jgi:hypothetical protein
MCPGSCWDKTPANRPSMEKVVRIMRLLFPFFRGYDEPVQYPSQEVCASLTEGEI